MFLKLGTKVQLKDGIAKDIKKSRILSGETTKKGAQRRRRGRGREEREGKGEEGRGRGGLEGSADFFRHLIHSDAFVAGDMAFGGVVLPRGED